jgi:hypothetical protein
VRVPLSGVQLNNVGSATRSPIVTSSASARRRITDSRSSDAVVLDPAQPVRSTPDETGQHLL